MDDLPIAVWQTCAHAAAFEEDLSYMAFVQQRQVLVKAPVLVMFIHMSGNPLHSLEAAELIDAHMVNWVNCIKLCLPNLFLLRVQFQACTFFHPYSSSSATQPHHNSASVQQWLMFYCILYIGHSQ